VPQQPRESNIEACCFKFTQTVQHLALQSLGTNGVQYPTQIYSLTNFYFSLWSCYKCSWMCPYSHVQSTCFCNRERPKGLHRCSFLWDCSMRLNRLNKLFLPPLQWQKHPLLHCLSTSFFWYSEIRYVSKHPNQRTETEVDKVSLF